ncbi:MAG: Asp23/Gls24 family envelope stress response protein [Actinomycetota bacterium]|nr:Asp23/Gls24 family envelope stress response protein [Actinomycetota bacterium]MDD5667217.1 Asp23/Gls24 family envelope stress response protein [Actinomycetota bacterium]
MKEDVRSEGIEVSSEAIATLAAQAANEVEGATVYVARPSSSITSRVKREFMHKGIKVSREEDTCRLGVYLKVDYGTNIPALAEEVRAKVKEYVEGLTELKVEDIEIVIEDIEPPA